MSVLSEQIDKNTELYYQHNDLLKKHNDQRVQASKESKILANYRVKESKRDKQIEIFAMYPNYRRKEYLIHYHTLASKNLLEINSLEAKLADQQEIIDQQ